MIIVKPKNFDLDQIYASGQCFRWEKLEEGYDADNENKYLAKKGK